MNRHGVIAGFTLALILTASCASQSAPLDRPVEGGVGPSYAEWLRDESSPREWADIVSVKYVETERDERAVEIVGVATKEPPTSVGWAYAYTSDGSTGPVGEFSSLPDQQFRVIVELPLKNTTQEYSRFEVVSISEQWVYIDMDEGVWAEKDRGVLSPILDSSGLRGES